MQHHSRRLYCFGALFCLLILFSACGTLAGNGTSSTPTPAKTPTQLAATPTATTEQAQAAQTCPATGSARSAVMPPMTVENHANVVFLAQQSENTLLQRYDVITGETQTILQIQQADLVLGINISPDGQWVLFGGLVQDQSAIQLVRMDGQQLQTLYCAPSQIGVGSLVLSPDQHYLIFSQVNADETESMLYLLDMRTGKLQVELSTLQPNYPLFGQYASSGSSLLSLASPLSRNTNASDSIQAQPFNPLGSKQYPMYVPMKWATNGSVYLLGKLVASPSPPPQLVLLRDITKDVSQQGSSVQPVVVTPETNNCQAIDVTAGNRQIVCSSFAQFGPAAPSSILLQSTTGGAFHAIYSNPAGGSLNARALSNPSIIIFTLYRANQPPVLFKINSDGSGLSQLMAGATTKTLLNLAASYLPWSNASRDSTLYALQLYDLATDKQTLVYGHMSGGAPVTFASSANALDIVGWTEL
jgi:dipeptidyl aminopeptidase/acylaminoacyl peptidase